MNLTEKRVLVMNVTDQISLWRIIGTDLYESRVNIGDSFIGRVSDDVNHMAELLHGDGFFPDVTTAYHAIKNGGVV